MGWVAPGPVFELPAEPVGMGALLPIGAELGAIVEPVEPVVSIGLEPGPVFEFPAEPVGIWVPLLIEPPELGAPDPIVLLWASTKPVLATTIVAAMTVALNVFIFMTILPHVVDASIK